MKFNGLKMLLPVLIIFSLPLFSFDKATPQQLFADGNARYVKGDYKAAIGAYQKILDSGYQSAELYLNMGNANYKMGDFTPAIWCYEKAHKLSPGDDDVNFNIQLVHLKTIDKIDAVPEFFLYKWWRSVILSCSLSAFAVISDSLFLIGSALLILYFFSPSAITKRAAFFTSIMLFVISIFVVYIAERQQSYFSRHKAAIVFSNSVTVKNSPADNSTTLFVIHDGTKVNILDDNKGWVKIGLANGNKGWIKTTDIKMI